MNTKARTTLQSMKDQMKHEKQKEEMRRSKLVDGTKASTSRLASSKERKLALQQDVDKLKNKLKREENIRRALERAFSRPLGALPRLPPYVPTSTMELIAEVAVLEEEVVWLEDQIVHFRQDLYQEAVYISSSKKKMENSADLYGSYSIKSPKPDRSKISAQGVGKSATFTARHSSSILDGRRKENQSCTSSTKNAKPFPSNKAQVIRTSVKRPPIDYKSPGKHLDLHRLQLGCRLTEHENAETRTPAIQDEKGAEDNSPNKISECILKCLSSIFLRMSSMRNRCSMDNLPSLSKLALYENRKETEFWDPYDICEDFGKRDIGQYKHLCAIEAASMNLNKNSNCLFLVRRLKQLLGKLASVELQNLTHQEKLAFWINIYNACMMNAFLEHGIPESPEMVVALMRKATINVGGHLLNAIKIEHFILRIPYHLEQTFSKASKNDEMMAGSTFGLELSEPLVTFALSCGSWSSPAVRVYTASQVEKELEEAKRDYLQAAVGISARKFAIPKLLDWYLLDFAKDVESFLDWICLQLPSELRKEAIKCLERRKIEPLSQFVQVMPYEFSFRYLLRT